MISRKTIFILFVALFVNKEVCCSEPKEKTKEIGFVNSPESWGIPSSGFSTATDLAKKQVTWSGDIRTILSEEHKNRLNLISAIKKSQDESKFDDQLDLLDKIMPKLDSQCLYEKRKSLTVNFPCKILESPAYKGIFDGELTFKAPGSFAPLLDNLRKMDNPCVFENSLDSLKKGVEGIYGVLEKHLRSYDYNKRSGAFNFFKIFKKTDLNTIDKKQLDLYKGLVLAKYSDLRQPEGIKNPTELIDDSCLIEYRKEVWKLIKETLDLEEFEKWRKNKSKPRDDESITTWCDEGYKMWCQTEYTSWLKKHKKKWSEESKTLDHSSKEYSNWEKSAFQKWSKNNCPIKKCIHPVNTPQYQAYLKRCSNWQDNERKTWYDKCGRDEWNKYKFAELCDKNYSESCQHSLVDYLRDLCEGSKNCGILSIDSGKIKDLGKFIDALKSQKLESPMLLGDINTDKPIEEFIEALLKTEKEEYSIRLADNQKTIDKDFPQDSTDALDELGKLKESLNNGISRCEHDLKYAKFVPSEFILDGKLATTYDGGKENFKSMIDDLNTEKSKKIEELNKQCCCLDRQMNDYDFKVSQIQKAIKQTNDYYNSETEKLINDNKYLIKQNDNFFVQDQNIPQIFHDILNDMDIVFIPVPFTEGEKQYLKKSCGFKVFDESKENDAQQKDSILKVFKDAVNGSNYSPAKLTWFRNVEACLKEYREKTTKKNGYLRQEGEPCIIRCHRFPFGCDKMMVTLISTMNKSNFLCGTKIDDGKKSAGVLIGRGLVGTKNNNSVILCPSYFEYYVEDGKITHRDLHLVIDKAFDKKGNKISDEYWKSAQNYMDYAYDNPNLVKLILSGLICKGMRSNNYSIQMSSTNSQIKTNFQPQTNDSGLTQQNNCNNNNQYKQSNYSNYNNRFMLMPVTSIRQGMTYCNKDGRQLVVQKDKQGYYADDLTNGYCYEVLFNKLDGCWWYRCGNCMYQLYQ